eukprot:s1632_g9.t1
MGMDALNCGSGGLIFSTVRDCSAPHCLEEKSLNSHDGMAGKRWGFSAPISGSRRVAGANIQLFSAARQSPGSQALFTDEELARILQDSSPTYTGAESRTDVQDMTDEELARMLQEQENAGGRSRTNPETSPLSLPDESPPLQRRTSRSFYLGDMCERWPQLIAVASSGAFFGCCAGPAAQRGLRCGASDVWAFGVVL